MPRETPPQIVQIPAPGAELTGRLTLPPAGTAPKGAVVLHGATGVPAPYYDAFARWLAETRGFAVLGYDYRDFGASARGLMARAVARMSDWGLYDQPAALDWVQGRFAGLPHWVIGHSVGGIWLDHHPGIPDVARVITLGAGLPHLTDHPWPWALRACAFWFGPLPLITRALGYAPLGRLGLGADLPAGVFRQWRRWCLNRGWNAVDLGRSLPSGQPNRLTAPWKVIALADDRLVPPPTVWRLMERHPLAIKSQLVLRPADHGLAPVGHIAAFHRRNAALWPSIIA